MNKNEKGFGVVELLLALLVIGLLAGAGWLAYDRSKNSKTSNPSTTPENSQTNTSNSDEQPTTITSNPVERLEKLYKDYLSDTSSYQGDSGLAAFKANGLVASDYTSVNNVGETLVCGQEAYPDSITVQLVDKTDTMATLMGVKVYKDGSKASESIQAEMTLNASSEWQLKKTTCIRS